MNLILNVLLVLSITAFTLSLLRVVFDTMDRVERTIRAGALTCGALVVLGAQATGASYANFIVKAWTAARPLTIGFLGVGVPAAAGIAVGWYLVRALKKDDNLALRILAFIGMLTVAQFFTTYAVALHVKGFELGKAALPNVSFVLGLLMYIVLRYRTHGSESEHRYSTHGAESGDGYYPPRFDNSQGGTTPFRRNLP